MVELESGRQLRVEKIREGTVIDHITSGTALAVLRILNISGREGFIVSILMNVPSKKLGKKDIVKIEGREISPKEVAEIALVEENSGLTVAFVDLENNSETTELFEQEGRFNFSYHIEEETKSGTYTYYIVLSLLPKIGSVHLPDSFATLSKNSLLPLNPFVASSKTKSFNTLISSGVYSLCFSKYSLKVFLSILSGIL